MECKRRQPLQIPSADEGKSTASGWGGETGRKGYKRNKLRDRADSCGTFTIGETPSLTPLGGPGNEGHFRKERAASILISALGGKFQ